MTFLKHWKIIVGVFSILSLAGAFFAYGVSQYQKGYNAAVVEYSAENERANNSARTEAENVRREQIGMDRAGVNRSLCGLGIMRERARCD